jgi:hypothetical protein
MELQGASFLYTMATLMVTFAGFSALLMMLRQAMGAQLSALDRFLTRTVVGHLMVLTAGALLPPLLQLYAMPEAWVWKASAILFGIPYLTLLLTFSRRRIAATGSKPPRLVSLVFIGLGSASLAVMIVWVLTDLAQPAAAYVTALTLNFFTMALAFVVALEVILRQRAE